MWKGRYQYSKRRAAAESIEGAKDVLDNKDEDKIGLLFCHSHIALRDSWAWN